jgi:hypothetical protein
MLDSEKFDWLSDDAVVLRSYGSLAVYTNPHGDLVVRQESKGGDEDARVVIPRSQVLNVLEAISGVLAGDNGG